MARRTTKRPSETDAPQGERLQKILAASGIASRRAAEQLIVEGRVSVNGRIVRELGTRAHAQRDKIRVDGKRVGRAPRARYYVLHKPRGVLSTTSDPEQRKTVLDLLHVRGRFYPVGRLDALSEGLVLLTNDGALAQALLHPSHEVPRVYRVSVQGRVDGEVLRRLARGVELDDGPTSPCEVQLRSQGEDRSVVELTLREGRRHQIRRMLDAVGHPVRRLVRTQFGPLRLRGLALGEYRPTDASETAALLRMSEQASRTRAASKRRPKRPTRQTIENRQ